MSGLMSVRYILNENILICSLRDRTCLFLMAEKVRVFHVILRNVIWKGNK